MTMILVCFDAAPTLCEEKLKAEERWIELVRQVTEGESGTQKSNLGRSAIETTWLQIKENVQRS